MDNAAVHLCDKTVSPSIIEHTALRDNLTEQDILAHLNEAIDLNVGAVCIPVQWVPFAKKKLSSTNILVVTVADFPKGTASPNVKAEEAVVAKNLGADEIDLVMDYEALIAKDYGKVLQGLLEVVKNAAPVPVKVIVETSALSREQLSIACALVALSGARFIKTSTGFHKAGAQAIDIALMRQLLPSNVLIKASGGISTPESALAMVKNGADRIGASKSRNILVGH